MRLRIFVLLLVVLMSILLAALAYTQIIKHDKYKIMSEENRLKIIPLMAPRGGIFDRNNRRIVKDKLAFNVSIIYSRLGDIDAAKSFLFSFLNVPMERIERAMRKARAQPYLPTDVATDIGVEKAIGMEELASAYPGILLDVSVKREYPEKEISSNFLGYLGLINRSELERLKPYGYRMDDLVGRDGVEKYYDNYLRGRYGGKQVEVDHNGREVATLGFKEPAPGKNVYLTIDLDLQEFCTKLLKNKRGSIIVMNAQDGAILVMASAPGYDPRAFIDEAGKKNLKEVLESEDYPMMNRAISGAYPPGSVFKIILATAALESKVATKDTSFQCPGYLALGKKVFRCWRKSGHGEQTMEEAIKNSCNVYFYNLGLVLGADRISKFAGKLGFGALTGVDLTGENPGIVPTPEWKKERLQEVWFKGDTVNYAIGQGYVLCSPIQLARMISVFANKGFLVRPHIATRVGDISINAIEKINLALSPETTKTVRSALLKCVNDKYGTGIKAKQGDFLIAGKTGTAQTSKGKSHGWFAGFAPFENAKLAVVVFDEYGGKGGYYAAETAGKVFRKANELGHLKVKYD